MKSSSSVFKYFVLLASLLLPQWAEAGESGKKGKTFSLDEEVSLEFTSIDEARIRVDLGNEGTNGVVKWQFSFSAPLEEKENKSNILTKQGIGSDLELSLILLFGVNKTINDMPIDPNNADNTENNKIIGTDQKDLAPNGQRIGKKGIRFPNSGYLAHLGTEISVNLNRLDASVTDSPDQNSIQLTESLVEYDQSYQLFAQYGSADVRGLHLFTLKIGAKLLREIDVQSLSGCDSKVQNCNYISKENKDKEKIVSFDSTIAYTWMYAEQKENANTFGAEIAISYQNSQDETSTDKYGLLKGRIMAFVTPDFEITKDSKATFSTYGLGFEPVWIMNSASSSEFDYTVFLSSGLKF